MVIVLYRKLDKSPPITSHPGHCIPPNTKYCSCFTSATYGGGIGSEPQTPTTALHGFDFNSNMGYISETPSTTNTPSVLIANLHDPSNVPVITVSMIFYITRTMKFWVKGSKPSWSGAIPTGQFPSFRMLLVPS